MISPVAEWRNDFGQPGMHVALATPMPEDHGHPAARLTRDLVVVEGVDPDGEQLRDLVVRAVLDSRRGHGVATAGEVVLLPAEDAGGVVGRRRAVGGRRAGGQRAERDGGSEGRRGTAPGGAGDGEGGAWWTWSASLRYGDGVRAPMVRHRARRRRPWSGTQLGRPPPRRSTGVPGGRRGPERSGGSRGASCRRPARRARRSRGRSRTRPRGPSVRRARCG